ncbi:MAG: dihydroorotase [Planctomycetota bacterium]|jgi:dihydroorotase
MVDSLTLTRPDDWHLHFRDGDALRTTVPATAKDFGRAVVMPNLRPPISGVDAARAYRGRILECLEPGSSFEPLMTLYLTDRTSPLDIRKAADEDWLVACKLYPAGATTNSDHGVTSMARISDVLSTMEEVGMPLLVHGEATDAEIDIFDREQVFIERELKPLLERFPRLRVVFEHITTLQAAEFVEGARDGVAATITPQHLLMNRNDLLVGGLKPHNYCLPVLKRQNHQVALQRAATSGNPRFFLGTDSAPHGRADKENDCGCAGCYCAPAALSLYAEFFDGAGELERLEGFAAHFGADFYGRTRNPQHVTLYREPWTVPERVDYVGADGIVPFWAGRELNWKVRETE